MIYFTADLHFGHKAIITMQNLLNSVKMKKIPRITEIVNERKTTYASFGHTRRTFKVVAFR